MKVSVLFAFVHHAHRSHLRTHPHAQHKQMMSAIPLVTINLYVDPAKKVSFVDGPVMFILGDDMRTKPPTRGTQNSFTLLAMSTPVA